MQKLKDYENKLMGLIPPERIKTVDIPRPPKNIIDAFNELDGLTPTISDVLDSLGIKGAIPASALRPVIPGKKVVGPAITIRYIPENTTPDFGYINQTKAKLADRDLYAIGREGDVAVFDAAGLENISVMGGLSALVAKQWNLAGNIIDGGVRDIDTIRQLDYPVWSSGQTPITGKYRVEAMEINVPVTIKGIRVNPGDLIVADDSGVVVIPNEKIDLVLEKTIEAIEKENKIVELIKSGASIAEMKKILPPSKW